MGTILLTLDQETYDALGKAAFLLKRRRSVAAIILFKRGLTALERNAQAWDVPENEELLHELDVIRSNKADLIRELMVVDGKIAAFSFAVYEAYRTMSNVLMAYSGKRAQAERLASILRDSGIEYDLAPGLAPNYDRLASEYLFRDKTNVD